jgi:hypothetical protein
MLKRFGVQELTIPLPKSNYTTLLSLSWRYRSAGSAFQFRALFFFAGRVANPPWGASLRSRIHKSGGLAMIASILKRTHPQGMWSQWGRFSRSWTTSVDGIRRSGRRRTTSGAIFIPFHRSYSRPFRSVEGSK